LDAEVRTNENLKQFLTARDSHNKTALIRACWKDCTRKNSQEWVRALIRLKSDVNATMDRYIHTSLRMALQCKNGNHTEVVGPEIAKMLIIAGADVNMFSESRDFTLLHDAAEKSILEAAEILIVAGANVDAQEDKYGQTALHWAVRLNDPKILNKTETLPLMEKNRPLYIAYGKTRLSISSNFFYQKDILFANIIPFFP
jgi:ankyrin repeat protein